MSADDKDKLVTKSGLDLTSLTYRNIPRICRTKSGKLVIRNSGAVNVLISNIHIGKHGGLLDSLYFPRYFEEILKEFQEIHGFLSNLYSLAYSKQNDDFYAQNLKKS